jgi:hypothetical protein
MQDGNPGISRGLVNITVLGRARLAECLAQTEACRRAGAAIRTYSPAEVWELLSAWFSRA